MSTQAHIITVGGKGGVGKTSVSAMLVKLLLASGTRLLLIDADPVISVAYTLGEEPSATLGDFRQSLIESPRRQRDLEARPVKDAIKELITVSSRGYDLLAMGRAEGKGCFCGVNELLRFGVESLCSDYDTVLVDCEAGIEQVNRRALHRIDELILVADTSRRAMESVAKVRDIAVSYNEGKPIELRLLVNRVRSDEDRSRAGDLAAALGLEVSAFVPDDSEVHDYNACGRTLLDLPEGNAALAALTGIIHETS